MDVPDAEGVFLKLSGRLQWLLLISFELCVWVQRFVNLVDDSSGVWVGVWLAGCVLVRMEDWVAGKACLLVGYNLDY